jgi:glutamate-1-semialdehyde 2,1-aminomutase
LLLKSLLAVAALALGWLLVRRLQLSRAKHPSLAGHVRMSRLLSRLVPHYEFDERRFFDADGADAALAARRRAGFERLSRHYRERQARGLALTDEVRARVADLDFTSRYRVPFPFSRVVRERLPTAAFLERAAGHRVVDLDGNELIDVTGSYGVNLLGNDAYKAFIERAGVLARELGPLLGPYHPLLARNVERLCRISGHESVSFHMSGTEAVMQAVRLARYHTRRQKIVRFCGAYNGWWDDVQPGVGNPVAPRATLTLREMHAATLAVLRSRRDIACVLVNPLQALHPNSSAPADSALVDSSRRAGLDRAGYSRWLRELRAACSASGTLLVFDEVFVGFRLAAGGAQEYFGVRADLVTYGKTLGGGLPVGALCGSRALMQRYREDRPADICFARGTFNSHPHVMAAMSEFLDRMEAPAIRDTYARLDATWDARARALNARLEGAGLPVRIAHLSSIWTVLYGRPSRYNWMLQFYLRVAGLALPWIGTGRMIFPITLDDAEFEAIVERFVAASAAMAADGWWEGPTSTDREIRRQVGREMRAQWLRSRVGS